MSNSLILLAHSVIDRLSVTAVGQPLAIPIDFAEPGQERALMLALVDACFVRGVALRLLQAPPRLIEPREIQGEEKYRGVALVQNPRDLEQIILVRQ